MFGSWRLKGRSNNHLNRLATMLWGLLLYGVVIAAEPPEPQSLLNEMAAASHRLNYDGVFMYRLGNRLETMRIIYKSSADGPRQRLVSLTGYPREVIRNKDDVRCYFPENKSVVVEKSRLGKLISAYFPTPAQSISAFYHFELAGEDRIAGMDAWIVNVKSNDQYRYSYQIWIAKESKLLLRSELKTQRGVTLEQMIFAKLDILDEIDDALLQPSLPIQDYILYDAMQDSPTSVVANQAKKWSVTWLPVGFKLNEHKHQTHSNQRPVEHLIYTDGLAMVSVFVESINEQQTTGLDHASKFGGVNTYTTYVDGYQVTAVGEVPQATVKQMVASIKSF